ncbi:hypothetical protein BDU57DRAFT_524649 [Ampelomyces quisqualis]|uniref:Uncharacterized protein n=1 Tax=Ampelomyces quisqualis TaxID=50730 RepID=A0A6A5Q7T9_AMPQU|nr:hypothetical protein BDU57DRAFT_524649 [Ampelomyces quisqualis]
MVARSAPTPPCDVFPQEFTCVPTRPPTQWVGEVRGYRTKLGSQLSATPTFITVLTDVKM